MDRQLVVVDPLTKRGGLDLRTLIGVDSEVTPATRLSSVRIVRPLSIFWMV